ncbi:RNHCP domain-containing protein [Patescibacteria group bacterium]|nr:RNHCP domain-containing protein [Patescibacteria group bacterium]
MERKNFYRTGNDAFTCEKCHMYVEALSNGSFRNHCPYCLWCKHVDVVPGDRSETCRALMQPVRTEWHSKKGWMIVHACVLCGKEQRNKTAPDDTVDVFLGFV